MDEGVLRKRIEALSEAHDEKREDSVDDLFDDVMRRVGRGSEKTDRGLRTIDSALEQIQRGSGKRHQQ